MKQIFKLIKWGKEFIEKHITYTYHLRPMIIYLSKQKKKSLIDIEIGVLRGANAYSIMQHLDIKQLYLVDPYIIYDDGTNYYPNRSKDLEIAKRTLKIFKNKIKFIFQLSEDAHKEFLPNTVDFVYIDGNHLYDWVKKDIEFYYPLVKKGGFIGGHDFRADCEGLCRAVLEFVDKNKLTLHGYKTDWWIKKQ